MKKRTGNGFFKPRRHNFLFLLSMLVFCVGFLAVFTRNILGTSYITVDLTDTIAKTYLKFEINDETKRTATFLGFDLEAVQAVQYTTFNNTLEVPEKVRLKEVNNEIKVAQDDDTTATEYTVTKVNTATDATKITGFSINPTYGYNCDGFYYSIQLYGSHVKAVILPDTIEEMNKGAFYGMASLEYYQAPFVGTTKNDIDIASTNTKLPIHVAFAKGYLGTGTQYDTRGSITHGDTDYQVEYYQLDNTGKPVEPLNSTISSIYYWFDITDNTKYWFEMPKNLAQVVITGGSRTQIKFGNRTFFRIFSLKSVTLPEELLNVGEYTFAECTALEEVNLPDKLSSLSTIGMFSGCTALPSITIPYGITEIPSDTFFKCNNLADVKIPATIETIGDRAFYENEILNMNVFTANKQIIPSNSEVALPEGLLTIGANAFEGVNTIVTLHIPNSVQAIENEAFRLCKNIEDITIPFVGRQRGSSSESIQNNFGWIFGSTATDLVDYYEAWQNGVKYFIPVKLQKVEITDESVVETMTMGNLCTFANNVVSGGVQTIAINANASVKNGAFTGSNGLVYLTVPAVDLHLARLFFYNSTIQADVKNVSNSTATGYGSNQVGYIPDGLINVSILNQEVITSGSFHNCLYIESVTISNATQLIEDNIFYNTPSLDTLTLPFVGYQRGEYWKDWTYWNTWKQRNLFTWVFSYSTSGGTYQDRSIAVGNNGYVRKVPSTLKHIVITDETVIGDYAFRNLTSLETLVILNTSNRDLVIEQYACYNCSNLKSIRLPFIGHDKNVQNYNGTSHRAGWIFGSASYSNSYKADAFYIPNSLEDITIDYVNGIPESAFDGMSSIKSITFNPSGDTSIKVTAVAAKAFNMCTNLSSIGYPAGSNFIKVGDYAFNNCAKINEIRTAIPAYNVDNAGIILGAYALAGTSIPEITFTKINEVGEGAFARCLNLENVDVTSNVEKIGSYTFAGCKNLLTASLARGLAAEYQFKDCVKLKDIDLSDVIVDGVLPAGIFYNCQALKYRGTLAEGLILSNQIKEIGKEAFYNCIGFTNFSLPSLTETIHTDAFTGCINLDSIVIPRDTIALDAPLFTNAVGGGFVIWVYMNEEFWPSTWVTGWNANNPVKVIPKDTEDMYIYEYSTVLKGFVIVGLDSSQVAGNSIEGQLTLPKTRNAVPVRGIIANRDTNASIFANQAYLTKVVLPQSYELIGEKAFDNGRRIDVYVERGKDEGLKYISLADVATFSENNDLDPTKFVLLNSVTNKSNNADRVYITKIIKSGYFFFGDIWEYGTGIGGSNSPYIKLNTLVYYTDPYTIPSYNGKAWDEKQIPVEDVYFDENYAVAIKVGSDTATNMINSNLSVGTNLFNFKYSNNISVSTARNKAYAAANHLIWTGADNPAVITATINSANYATFLANSRTTTLGDYTIYLTGTGTKNFLIQKHSIDVLVGGYDQDDLILPTKFGFSETNRVYYNQRVWSYGTDPSDWNTNSTSLVSDFGSNQFKFSGVISTKHDYVGTYVIDGLEYNSDFEWTTAWKVMYGNSNVTDNFELCVYLQVQISPMEIEIEWTGRASFDYIYTSATTRDGYSLATVYYAVTPLDSANVDENNYKEYYISPSEGTFVPVTGEYDSTLTYYDIEEALGVNHDNYTQYVVREISMSNYEYTGFEIEPQARAVVRSAAGGYKPVTLYSTEIKITKVNSTPSILLPDTGDTNEARASLKNAPGTQPNYGARNYKIVNYYNTQDKLYAQTTYKCVKANLNINIYNMQYLIGYDDNYYSFSDWTNVKPKTANNPNNYYEIDGLSSLSHLYGIIVTQRNGAFAHDRGLYRSLDGDVAWNRTLLDNDILTDAQKESIANMMPTSMSNYEFIIVQEDGDGNITKFENDYYNVHLNVEVQINYNQFALEYYIANNNIVDEMPLSDNSKVEQLEIKNKVTTEKTAGESTDTNNKIEVVTGHLYYGFDGDNSRYFKIDIVNSGLFETITLNSSEKPVIDYKFTDSEGHKVTGCLKIEHSLEEVANLKYTVHVTITRKNFVTQELNLEIHIKKRDVLFDVDVLSKIYDGEPVSYYGWNARRTYYVANAYGYEEYLVQGNPISSEDQLKNILENENVTLYYKNYYDEYVKVNKFVLESGKKSNLVRNNVLYVHQLSPEVQSVTLVFYTKLKSDLGEDVYKVWDKPYNPTYPGTYYVKLTATEHDFFKKYDDYIEFVIEQRPIDLYLDSSDPFVDNHDDPSKVYNSAQTSRTLNSETAPSTKVLIDSVTGEDNNLPLRTKLFVDDDQLFGVINTKSALPGVYRPEIYDSNTSTDTFNWYWAPNWSVIDPNTGEDHTAYYKIVLHNEYTILKDSFIYNIESYTTNKTVDGAAIAFDGAYHAVKVNVTYPAPSSVTSLNKDADTESVYKYKFNSAGTFFFDARTSTRENYDYLKVYKNGQELVQFEMSGIMIKSNQTISVVANDVVEFKYIRSSDTVTENDNAVYLSNLYFMKNGQNVVSTDYTVTNDTTYPWTAPQVNYTIQYSDCYLPEDSTGWRSMNYYYVDSSIAPYNVWVKISAPNFNTVIERAAVKIKDAVIEAELPSIFKKDSSDNYIISNSSGTQVAVTADNKVGGYITGIDTSFTIDHTWDQYSLKFTNVDPYNTYIRYDIYKRDGSSWVNVYSGTNPVITAEGSYQMTYYMEVENFEIVNVGLNNSKAIHFVVTEANLLPFGDDLTIEGFNGDYNGEKHAISITFADPLKELNAEIYYRLKETDSWRKEPFTFVDAGEYTVYYKITGNGIYRTVTGSKQVIIHKLNYLTLQSTGNYTAPTAASYKGIYDGDKHRVTVDLGSFVKDPFDKELTNKPTIYYTTKIYAVDDNIDSNWTTTPVEETNVCFTKLFVRIVMKNYEDITFENLVIQIDKNTDPKIKYTPDLKVQYQKRDFEYGDLKIETKHDGEPTATVFYYLGKYDGTVADPSNGYIVKNDPVVKLTEETVVELNYYYVEIFYPETKNCAAKSIAFGFQIVPRRVVADYDTIVEYSGYEQLPDPTVKSGTSDKLYLIATRKDSTDVPVELGTYQYKFEFTVPQKNYILVIPESADDDEFYDLDDDGKGDAYPENTYSGDDDYPFNFTISKIHLNIVIDAKMDCDYEAQKYWELEEDYTWSSFGWYKKIVNVKDKDNNPVLTHQFTAHMITNSYARGTYYYNTDMDMSQISNKVIVTNVQLLDVTDPDNPVDVSNYYEVTYDITVWIHLPLLNEHLNVHNEPIVYDGRPHTIDVTVDAAIRGAIFSYLKDSEYKANKPWSSSPVLYTDVGTYRIWYKVESPMTEDYIDYVDLEIIPATLELDIEEFDETYNAAPHYLDISITNVWSLNFSGAGEVKYYPVDAGYTEEELYDYYAGTVDEDSDIYKAGLDSVVNAGDYFAVIHIPLTNNWYKQVRVKTITVKQRAISMKFTDGNKYFEREYNGYKYQVTIGNQTNGAYMDLLTQTANTGLITGHSVSRNKSSKVQTVSPNAGIPKNDPNQDGPGKNGNYYGSNGFEFVEGTIIIRDSGGADVTANYKPVFSDDNLHVKITKINLQEGDFVAIDTVKQFDGLPANPEFSVNKSDGEITYTYYYVDEYGNATGTKLNEINASLVGKYYVYAKVEAGTNYYAWPYSPVHAIVEIVPRDTELVWTNTEVTFNGAMQIPVATFTDAFGETQQLYVTARSGENLDPGVIKAGIYEVFANTIENQVRKEDSKNFDITDNYHIVNFSTLFTINKIKYTFVINVKTDIDTKAWTRTFSNDNVGTIDPDNPDIFISGTHLDTIAFLNKQLTGNATLSTRLEDDQIIAGTYYQIGQFDLSDIKVVLQNDQTYNVTDSIEFDFDGMVEIVGKKIVTNRKNGDIVYIKYDGVKRALNGDIIKLISPVTKTASWLFEINDSGHVVPDQYPITEVGEYKVWYSITVSGYETLQVTFTVVVTAKDSYINFKSTLDQPYDGNAVTEDKVISTINNAEYNGYTDAHANLEFTFYPAGDVNPLPAGKFPVDAGEYRLVITSSADNDPNVIKNYSPLNVEVYFTISPKEISLKLDLDKLRKNPNDVTFTATDVIINSSDVQGLGSFSSLYYKLDISYESNTQNSIYILKDLIPYEDNAQLYIAKDKDADEINVEALWYVFISDENEIPNYSSTPKVTVGTEQYPNVSNNYSLRINLSVNIHYKKMVVKMPDVFEFDYDARLHYGVDDYYYREVGDLQSGISDYYYFDATNNQYVLFTTTPDFSGTTKVYIRESTVVTTPAVLPNDSNLKRTYSQNYNDLVESQGGYSEISNSNVAGSLPGEYVINYKYSYNGADSTGYWYDDYYGSYIIRIGYLKRNVTLNLDSYNREYNGLDIITAPDGNGQYLPSYTVTLANGPDGQPLDDILNTGEYPTATYVRKVSNEKVDVARNAGTYVVTLTIPASTYYEKTVISGEFTITQKGLYILGEYETGFTGNRILYNDFGGTSSKLGLYFENPSYDPDGTDIYSSTYLKFIPITSSSTLGNILVSNMVVRTSGSECKTYRASSKEVEYTGQPVIRLNNVDVTNNFNILLYKKYTRNNNEVTEETIITVQAGKITYEVKDTLENLYKVENNIGKYYSASVEVKYPTQTNQYQVRYSENKNDTTWENWSTTPMQYNTIKWDNGVAVPHVFYAWIKADNFKEERGIEVKCKISPAVTTIGLSELSKDYDGHSVKYPGSIITNNKETDSDDYVFTYQEYKNGAFQNMAQGVYPINAGVYRVNISIPGSANFIGANQWFTFEIVGLKVELNWSKKTFEYNGLSQAPTANFDGLTLEEENGIKIYYDYTPDLTNWSYDLDHKAVGSYTVKATLRDSNNNEITNYIFNDSSVSFQFFILPKKVTVSISASINYKQTAQTYAFYQNEPTGYDKTVTYNDSNDPTYMYRNYAGRFEVVGLLNDGSTVQHEILPNYYLETITSDGFVTNLPGNYISYDQFRWEPSLDGEIVIVDKGNGSEEVQNNYEVTYNLNAHVAHNNLQIQVYGFNGDYDGKTHTVTEVCNNIFKIGEPQSPTYYYYWDQSLATEQTKDVSGIPESAWSIDKSTVTFTEANPGRYLVYVKAKYDGFNDSIRYAYIIINKVDAGLQLKDPNTTFDKYYDGLAVAMPEMTTVKNIPNLDQQLDTVLERRIHDSSLYIKLLNGTYINARKYANNVTYYKIANVTDYIDANITTEAQFDAETVDLYVKDEFGNYVKVKAYDAQAKYYSYNATTNGTDATYQVQSVASLTEWNTFAEEYTTVSNAINAGTYRITISLGTSDNYKDATFTKTFVIRPRTVHIKAKTTDISKSYDYMPWSTALYNSTDVTYDEFAKTNNNMVYYADKSGTGENRTTDNGYGLIKGQVFDQSAVLMTASAAAGTYAATSDFTWQSGCVVKLSSSSSTQVQANYIFEYQLVVDINLAQMTVLSSNYRASVDDKEHGITIKVENPGVGYTIKYTTSLESDLGWNAPESAFTTTPYLRKEVGTVLVYYIITAPNFQDYKGMNVIEITGRVNSGQLVYEETLTYGDDDYKEPVYVGESTGVQTVTYYTTPNHTDTGTPVKPLNAGTYYFVLHLASDGVYAEEELEGTFIINPREVEVHWGLITEEGSDPVIYRFSEGLEYEYSGSLITPKAILTDEIVLRDYQADLQSYTPTAGTDVSYYEISVDSQYYKSKASDTAYPIVAVFNDPNFTVTNNTGITYKINRKKITPPVLRDDSSFEYYFEVARVDANGNKQYLGNGDQYVKTSSYVDNVAYYEPVDHGTITEAEFNANGPYYKYDSQNDIFVRIADYDNTITSYYQFSEMSNISSHTANTYYILDGSDFIKAASYDPSGNTVYFYSTLVSSAADAVGKQIYEYSGGRYVKRDTYVSGNDYFTFAQAADINESNHSNYYIYTNLGDEDIRTFGQKVVVLDNVGNEYVLDEDGTILGIKLAGTNVYIDHTGENALEYRIILDADTNADGVIKQIHQLTITLGSNYDNYCWDNATPQQDIVKKYVISPYTVPNITGLNDNASITPTLTASKYEFTGSPIEPTPKVRFYQGNELIYTMTEGVEYEISYKNNVQISNDLTEAYRVVDPNVDAFDSNTKYYVFNQAATVDQAAMINKSKSYYTYDMDRNMYVYAASYSSNIEYFEKLEVVSDATSYTDKFIETVNNSDYAHIIIKGINNFDFEIDFEFEIVDKTPEQFELKTGAKPTFVYVKDTNGALTFYDLRENPVVERNDETRDDIYLSHLHQKTKISTLLSQFTNNIDLISVYKNGVDYTDPTKAIDPSLYDSESVFVGTGCTLVLKNDKGEIVDHIKCLLRGDINGDGNITAVDTRIYIMINGGQISLDGIKNPATIQTSNYVNNSIYGVYSYYATIIDETSNDKASGPQLRKVFSYLAGSAEVGDINGEYEIV